MSNFKEFDIDSLRKNEIEDEEENDHLILTDAAITDIFKTNLQGSKQYHDKIVSLISQYNEDNDRVILEFKHYDLPDDLIDLFWKQGQAERVIKCLNEAVRDIFKEVHKRDFESSRDIDYDDIEAKFVIDDNKLLSKIGRLYKPKVVNKKLVVFDGVIMTKTGKIPHIINHVFKCYDCGKKYNDKLKKCLACDSRKIDLSIYDSKTVDTEILTISEHQEDMNPLAIEPESIDIIVHGPLVGQFNPGNHVRVTGFPKIFSPRGSDEKLNKGYNTDIITPSNLSVIVDVHNIQYIKTPTELLLSNPGKILDEHDINSIKNIRSKYNNDIELLNVLINSFAPHIYGHQAIKQTVLIQNVGSSHVKNQRTNINILIVGDPGIGKTKLLHAAKEISLHASMAVGRGASGVGLTASVIRDSSNRPRLSIGAAVLADKGLCIIDELSNISDEHKSHLLECMENGTLTINKHGINEKLNTNAAFLMATNPDSGKYSTYNTLPENIKLSPPFLSRFDLIFVVLDKVDEVEDQKLRVHIAAIYNKTDPPKMMVEESYDKIDTELLKKYLVYAKLQRDDVKITKEALKIFDNFHKDLRKPIKSTDVTAGVRQFEGMLRIAMALSRLLLKKEVTEEIAQFTMKLLNTAYESTGMKLGNSTGLNQNSLFSKDLTKIKPEKAFIEIMKLITEDNTKPVERVDILFALGEHLNMSNSDADELIDKMDSRDVLFRPKPSTYLLDTTSYHI